jgi:hypothetical protein
MKKILFLSLLIIGYNISSAQTDTSFRFLYVPKDTTIECHNFRLPPWLQTSDEDVPVKFSAVRVEGKCSGE